MDQRLYSNDYDGLYIATSSEARENAERLSGSVSHLIVLQNADNDLLILIPSSALPRRLHFDGGHLSVQVILDRRNQAWINNIGEVRSYLYPVHNSRLNNSTGSLMATSHVELTIVVDDAGSWSAKGDGSRQISA